MILPSHRTAAPPSPWHGSAPSNQENPSQVHRSHRCPSPQKQNGSQLERASKTIKHYPSVSPERRQAQREGQFSNPLDKSVAEPGSPTAHAGLRLCPASIPLPGATSAATPCLPSCSTSSLLLPTLRCRGCHQPHGREGWPMQGQVPLHFPPQISSQLLLPSPYPATPNTGSTSP